MWISVKSSLPEIDSRVLVHESDGFVTICKYKFDSYYSKIKPVFIDEQDEQPSRYNPTHWMPLPEPFISEF